MFSLAFFCVGIGSAQSPSDIAHRPLHEARDLQDLEALHLAANRAEGRLSPSSPAAELYAAALARSFEAEVALELGKKPEAASAAESGIRISQQLAKAQSNVAEYHRLLGTLCGQIIPANLFSAFQYGRCASEEIDTALKLDPKSAWAYLGRGVGNYYLPPAFGGGIDKAISDFRRATSLDPKLTDAWLWLGLSLRKKGDSSGARDALTRARALSPKRAWIQTQLQKTPVPAKAAP